MGYLDADGVLGGGEGLEELEGVELGEVDEDGADDLDFLFVLGEGEEVKRDLHSLSIDN